MTSKVLEPIIEALGSASGPQQEIVALVYGFNGRKSSPPREVAQQCGLSPHQVQQLVEAAVRTMRDPARSRLIREALVSADEQIWSALAGSTGIIYKAQSLAKTQASLPGELLFAIECQYGSLEHWLSLHARVTAQAWYRSG